MSINTRTPRQLEVLCQKRKDLKCTDGVLSPKYHMIVSSVKDPLSAIIRDMKSYTSRRVRNIIETNQAESRRVWMLEMMEESQGFTNKNNIPIFEFWQLVHPVND